MLSSTNIFSGITPCRCSKACRAKLPFPASTCISVNDEVVHGIPGARRLKSGDIVSLDTGCKLNGWCGDSAYTHPVGGVSPDVQRLLDVTRRRAGSGDRIDGRPQPLERSRPRNGIVRPRSRFFRGREFRRPRHRARDARRAAGAELRQSAIEAQSRFPFGDRAW